MAREITYLVMKNEFLMENQRMKIAVLSVGDLEMALQNKLQLTTPIEILQQNADKSFSPLIDISTAPDKLKVMIRPRGGRGATGQAIHASHNAE
eukprot:SAG11_NODE_6208_length_1364_cov_0.815020_3_plen_94_part_00